MTLAQRAILHAASEYSRALRQQNGAADRLQKAERKRRSAAQREELRKADAEHSKRCDELDAAEYGLFVAALVANGWYRAEAEKAV